MNIDELQAGRELDALIAEKVIGLEFPQRVPPLVIDSVIYSREIQLPHYSTDIAAAWQVVEKVKETQETFFYFAEEIAVICKTHKYFPEPAYHQFLGNLTPLVICKAALKVVAIES